jgi:hypothetical protein
LLFWGAPVGVSRLDLSFRLDGLPKSKPCKEPGVFGDALGESWKESVLGIYLSTAVRGDKDNSFHSSVKRVRC